LRFLHRTGASIGIAQVCNRTITVCLATGYVLPQLSIGFGPGLAEPVGASPQEAVMMVMWVLIAFMAVVGGVWVKTRRQRKGKATSYAGSN